MLSCESMIILWEQERWFIRQYCWNVRTRGLGGIMYTCWVVIRTMGCWDEQDGFSSFPLSTRTEKVPPAGGDVAPCKQSPRIIKQYAPIAKANGQARQARRRRSPCRRSAMLCPCCCFCRSALTEHGAETIAYNQSKNESKRNKRASKKRKQTSKDRKSKQAQARELASVLAIIIQAKQITPL